MATPIDVVMLKCRKISRREIGEIARYLPHKKKQNFGSLSNRRYSADCVKNLSGPAPNIGSQISRFHPNRFTFGGVIADRVKAVLLTHRVNP